MKDLFIKILLGICVAFTALNVGIFCASRIPPFSVGSCLGVKGMSLNIKVVENDILEGSTELEISIPAASGLITKKIVLSFKDLRADKDASLISEVSCQ